MEMCNEDEDSLEQQNFKCPYCSPELISQDNVIKDMENKHSMFIILYNFIFSKGSHQKKSRIRETSNLSTDADRRTDTILERLRDLSQQKRRKKKRLHNKN